MQAPGLWEVSLEARNADQVKDEQRGANSFLSRLVLANIELVYQGKLSEKREMALEISQWGLRHLSFTRPTTLIPSTIYGSLSTAKNGP